MAKAKQGAAPNADVKDGWDDDDFEELGTPNIDAWWHVEEGSTLVGQVCGRLRMSGVDDQVRDVVLVKTTQPCLGVLKGEKEGKEYPAGTVMGVTLRHRLMPLLECVRHSCLVKVMATDQTSLNGGRKMWNFKLRSKGQRAVPPPINEASGPSGEGDGFQDASTPF